MDNVIFRYTDEQAQANGVLVSLGGVDRVTGNLYATLEKVLDPESIMLRCQRWIELYGAKARQVYENNLDGGIWIGALVVSNGGVVLRAQAKALEGEQTIWILPNELGGLTLMFPEDY